jgi:hypothetical protein
MVVIRMVDLNNSTVKTLLGLGAVVLGFRFVGNKMNAESFGAEKSVCRCGKGISNPKCTSCDSPICADCDWQYANKCIECFGSRFNAESFNAELEDCYVCDGMFKQVYVCDNDCGFQCCEIDIDGNLIPVENADGTVKDYCITCYEEKYGAETFNAENEVMVHQLIVPYEPGGYATTYIYRDEKDLKKALWEFANSRMWEEYGDYPEYDWEGSLNSAENKATWDKKTQKMSIKKIMDYAMLNHDHYYEKIPLNLDGFRIDGEYGGVKNMTRQSGILSAETFHAEPFGSENDPDFDREKADRNKDGEISDWEQAVGNAVAKGIREHRKRKSESSSNDDMKHHMDMRWKEFTSKDKRDMELMDLHYGHSNRNTKSYFKKGYEYGWKLARIKAANGEPLYMVARAKDLIMTSPRKNGFFMDSGAWAGFEDSWRAYEGETFNAEGGVSWTLFDRKTKMILGEYDSYNDALDAWEMRVVDEYPARVSENEWIVIESEFL